MGAIIACVILAFMAWASMTAQRAWSDLRRLSSSVPGPPAMTKVSTKESGTGFCFVTCDEARITVILVAEGSLATVCRELGSWAKVVGTSPEVRERSDICGVAVTPYLAHGRQNVSAIARKADELVHIDDYEPQAARAAAAANRGSVIVELSFNSGLD